MVDVPEDKLSKVFVKKETLPMNFYVLDVLKFIHDKYSSHLANKGDPTNEGYDLILSDPEGRSLSKVLLGAKDCLLAQKKIIAVGCKIYLSSVCWQSNIHDGGSRGNLVHPVTERLEVLLPPEELQSLSLFDEVKSTSRYREWRERPLFSCRKYYISHWSSVDPPVGWVSPLLQGTVPTTDDLLGNLVPLSDAVDGVSASTVTFYGSVIGRVLSKSNIIHFAKPSDQYASPYPFQFYVELSDDTCSVPVVFWNANCLEWYSKVSIGDVLLLSRFTLKEVSDHKARTYNRLVQLRPPTQSKQVEINLNSDRQPLADVRLLLASQCPAHLSLPEVSMVINSVTKVMGIRESVMGSVGGVVTHRGRIERCHYMPPPPGALPGRPPPPQDRAILPFQQCQWVSLIDPTHPHPLLVQIASCSQPDCFSNIQVGSVLAVTNANIWTHSDTKVIYASSSVESQLYLVDQECPPHLHDHLEDLLMWRSTRACADKMKKFSSPLTVVTPPTTPNALSQLQLLLHQPDANIEVVSSDEDLHSLLRTLQHHQWKMFTLTASVVSVHVVPEDSILASETVAPDSAYATQVREEGTLQVATDELWASSQSQLETVEGAVNPAVEGVVGPFHVTGHPMWCMQLLSESGRSVVNVQFAPLPYEHWLNAGLCVPSSPDPIRAVLTSGRTSSKDIVEQLSLATKSLFQTPFSCLLSAYAPGGSFDVEITLLRAFPLL